MSMCSGNLSSVINLDLFWKQSFLIEQMLVKPLILEQLTFRFKLTRTKVFCTNAVRSYVVGTNVA